MKLVSAILAKNEAARDLERVIRTLLPYSTVCLLDDRSQDDTAKIARTLGCVVKERSVLKEPAWGAEGPARAELWDFAAKEAGDGWVLFCDADQILVGDPRPFTLSWESNTVAFPLYDCWESETTFRADGYWTAYQIARPWMVRPSMVPEGWTPQWNRQGLHVGHLPGNWVTICPIVTDSVHWLHLGYLTAERRAAKHKQYLGKRELLTPQEQAHAESILD